MATFANTLRNWASLDAERLEFYGGYPEVLLAWLNEAEARFADKGEVLQGVWSATVTSGSATLPSDFLREYVDRVKWDEFRYLKKIDYATASLVDTWSDVTHYSIFNGSLYVWAANSGTPTIPYIKKPTAITIGNIATGDLVIPTEYHRTLEYYLDSRWAQKKGDAANMVAFLTLFDKQAEMDGYDFRKRRDPSPQTVSTRF